MILPLSDSPNPRGTPFVNYALLATNIAIYALITLPLGAQPVDPGDPLFGEYVRVISRALPEHVSLPELLRQTSAYDLFTFRYGFRPDDPSVLTLFSAMFLHGGFLHLFGNMLILWIYGDNVEYRLGHLAYLVAYLGTGIAATLFHLLLAAASPFPMIGASGAISGVLGFYFLWFPRNRVRLLVFLFPFLMDVIEVPARLVLGLYLVLDNVLPLLLARGAEGGGVAHAAHIGGFIAGLAVAWVMDRRWVSGRPAEYAAREIPAAESDSPAVSVQRELAHGRIEAAARLYFALSPQASRGLLPPADLLGLAEGLRERGHMQAALVAYRRLLRDYPGAAATADAHLGAGLVQMNAFGQLTSAYQHFLDALDADPSPDTAARARAAIAAIESNQKLHVAPRRRV
jgi:membrane associated rhomboid family serine protease